MQFLEWLENNSLVTWVRESESLLGYTLHLAGHTIGMVLLVGPSLLIAARVLGLAPRLPIAPMAAFRPYMTTGFWITVVTGTVLFATAPIGYVRNPVFIVKIGAVVIAIVCLRTVVRELFDRTPNVDAQPATLKTKVLLATSLLFFLIAVVAGRLTAYSFVVVVESVWAFLVVSVAATVIGYVARLGSKRNSEGRRDFPSDIRARPLEGEK